jgi:hypothetical protein
VQQDVEFTVEIEKRAIDEDLRLVGGYAYVSKAAGVLLHDSQGDAIDPEVLREAVHDFMKSGRTMGVMHARGPDGEALAGGEIVEMAVFSGDFRPPGMAKDVDALWIVAKVNDDAIWKMVKAGDFRGFSIGGKGVREPVE